MEDMNEIECRIVIDLYRKLDRGEINEREMGGGTGRNFLTDVCINSFMYVFCSCDPNKVYKNT